MEPVEKPSSQPGEEVGKTNPSVKPPAPDSSAAAARLYGEEYYRGHCGGLAYERNEHWLRFFGHIADEIIRQASPGTVFDAGCAMGFLVEALRDRGVDARGADLSVYAISMARPDIRPYCRAGSITESLGGPYDLVTCIEVLEHLPPGEEASALRSLTAASDAVLFSSSPDDTEEETHFNVRPTRYWLEQFASLGFFPDPAFDASSITGHAFLVRRGLPESSCYLSAFDELLRLRQQIRASLGVPVDRAWLAEAGLPEADLISPSQIRELMTRLRSAEDKLHSIEASPGWRALAHYRRWLREEVRTRPWLSRIVEPLASGLLQGVSASSRSSAAEETQSPWHAIVEESLAGGDVIVCCDHPPADGSAVALGSLIVHGWAVARTGIHGVQVRIADAPPVDAAYGRESAEVARYLSDYPSADRAGFWVQIPTESMHAGLADVEIIAQSVDGKTSRVLRKASIDPRRGYDLWIEKNERALGDAIKITDGPRISIITPVYRTPIAVLKQCVDSVLKQSYPNWEFCVCDDASRQPELSRFLATIAANEPRVKVRTLNSNGGIAVATNAALEMATGDYVGFLDHDDELATNALAEVASALSVEDPPDVLYSDEDKIDAAGRRYDPFFKPTFSPDLLRSLNYVSHFLVVNSDLLRKAGGIREGFDGAQDFDLVLRLSEQSSKFFRIPKVLYHWRSIQGSVAGSPSAKPHSSVRAAQAIREHLSRSGSIGTVLEVAPNRFCVRYQLAQSPEVAIILPTGGNMKWLRRSIPSVIEKTAYERYRIYIADNSKSSDVEEYLGQLDDPRVVRLNLQGEPFNFSRICNRAVAATAASHLVFLNDDVEVISTEWLQALAELGTQPGVGAVGARLLFPDRSIQHAGVVLGIFGFAGHAFRGLPSHYPHYFALSDCIRNCSAVTGACLFTARKTFETIGGFDEEMPVAFQDVDYCLKVIRDGQRVVYTPLAELFHFESATRKREAAEAYAQETGIMRRRWGKRMTSDPFYSPNLTHTKEDFSLNLDA